MRGAAVCAAAALVLLSCKPRPAVVTPASAPAELELHPESCEAARRNPRGITYDDVRFVECGRPQPTSGEAFSLGEPIYSPGHGPSAVDAKFYAPGQCDHGGGSLTEHNIFFQPDHLGAAIDCSRRRCQARDPLGCRDLGALHWEDLILPGIVKNEAVAVESYKAGCDLGDGESCFSLADILDKRGDKRPAFQAYLAACRAAPPEIMACRVAAEQLKREGRDVDAKPLLLRACRGIKWTQSPFTARREGCGLLAEAAGKRGDVASEREYLRLECAYGGGEDSACEKIGLALMREGDAGRALPYLRKACGILPVGKILFARACEALSQLEEGRRKR